MSSASSPPPLLPLLPPLSSPPSSSSSSAAAAPPPPPPSHGLHFLAGAVGGAVSATLLSPLDIVRTRLQSSRGAAAHQGAARMLATIVRSEGVLALWRGLVPTIFGVGPARSLYFGGYALAKRQLGPEGAGLRGPALHFAGSALAGVASNTIMSPWWVIRLRLQLQQTPVEPFWRTAAAAAAAAAPPPPLPPGARAPYRGVLDCARRIHREEGWRAFYRGLSASYLGVAETVIQFTIYGELKRLMRSGSGGGGGGGGGDASGSSGAALTSHTWAFGLSAASKIVASLLTYPHEVLRTRMREEVAASTAQLKYRGLLQSTRLILREEGFAGLYGGMSVHLLRTVPNAAILLYVVETIVGGEV